MTSTPSIILTKRSGQSSDRPSGTVVQGGELAISRGASDPGLYFEDTAGDIRKIGPAHYGTTAPNSTPAGLPGNSVGETWTDSTTTEYYFKVWTGSAWVKVGAGFADSAALASQASSALVSDRTVTATGVPVATVAAALPGSAQQGSLFYQTTVPSGLYVYTTAGWAQV